VIVQVLELSARRGEVVVSIDGRPGRIVRLRFNQDGTNDMSNLNRLVARLVQLQAKSSLLSEYSRREARELGRGPTVQVQGRVHSQLFLTPTRIVLAHRVTGGPATIRHTYPWTGAVRETFVTSGMWSINRHPAKGPPALFWAPTGDPFTLTCFQDGVAVVTYRRVDFEDFLPVEAPDFAGPFRQTVQGVGLPSPCEVNAQEIERMASEL